VPMSDGGARGLFGVSHKASATAALEPAQSSREGGLPQTGRMAHVP
jgi:hypothetical protein